MDEANAAASAVNFEIKATSIDTASSGRDDHLRGPDFFNVAQFPTIAFQSTSVKKIDEKNFEVAGNLTLHGVTKPVSVRMEKTGAGKGREGEALVGFEGTFAIQRSQFGMGYGVPNLGDEVRLTVSVEAAKK
jgi:polyisoprenoid-binding protein YceI